MKYGPDYTRSRGSVIEGEAAADGNGIKINEKQRANGHDFITLSKIQLLTHFVRAKRENDRRRQWRRHRWQGHGCPPEGMNFDSRPSAGAGSADGSGRDTSTPLA